MRYCQPKPWKECWRIPHYYYTGVELKYLVSGEKAFAIAVHNDKLNESLL